MTCSHCSGQEGRRERDICGELALREKETRIKPNFIQDVVLSRRSFSLLWRAKNLRTTLYVMRDRKEVILIQSNNTLY